MNLEKLFAMQKALDENIKVNHPLHPGEDRFSKKILALNVELAEVAQEWRGFKFWSNNQKASDLVLKEYVDVLHFILSIGIELGYDKDFKIEDRMSDDSVDVQFNELFFVTATLYAWKEKKAYDLLLSAYIDFSRGLGLKWDDVESAYFEKNKINFERQENGY